MPDAPKPQKRATAAPKPKAKGVVAAKPLSPPEAKKIGRPSKYTPELVAEICQRISTGEPLRKICRDEWMPEWRTFYDWVEKSESLSAQVTRAREAGYDAMAEEALEISNTPHLGQKKVYSSGAGEDEDSMTVTEEDMLGHRKLQIETRLKLLACWNPKKYGNKVALGGDVDNPIKIEAEVQAQEMLAALLKNVELKKQAAANE